MTKEEILKIMEESEDHKVKVENARGETIEGIVDLYESRFDNEDDEEPYKGEASICLDEESGEGWLLYESDIKSIEILD